MANHASAEKAARQATKRKERNQNIKKSLRNEVKKLRLLIGKKFESKTEASSQLKTQFNEVQKLLMRAAHKKVIKKNHASRKISRLNSSLDKVMSAS